MAVIVITSTIFISFLIAVIEFDDLSPFNKTFINSVKMGVMKFYSCVRVSFAKSTAIYGIILKDVANFVA